MSADIAQLEIESNGTENLIRIRGKLLLFNTISVRTKIMSSLHPETSLLKIDLSRLEQMDSSGLGMLFALRRAMIGRKGDIVLLNVPRVIKNILEITGLSPFFKQSAGK